MSGISRRSFLKTAAAAAIPQAPESPNVLLLMCDQLTPRVLAPYGGPVETPNIARIAARGVIFRGATCTTPFCSPSRASLVTGRYPHTHGIVYNVMHREYPAAGAPPDEGIHASDETTEKTLHEAGYSTHQYGKWHLAGDRLPYLPDQFGEHREYAAEMEETFAKVRQRSREEWMDWYGWALPVDVSPKHRASLETDPLPPRKYAEFIEKAGRLRLPLEQNFDVRVGDKTVDRLNSLGPEPFMITASFNLPHDPNVVPSPYYEMYEPARLDLPANFGVIEERFRRDWSRRLVGTKSEDRIRELLRIYYASVRLIDDQIGRILDALEGSGRLEETVILFTADHGDMAGAHGMFWKSTSSFYDDVATIPFILRYPRLLPPGKSDLPASLVDIRPTLLELTGRPVPREVDGRSLVGPLSGKSGRRDRTHNFCERISAGRPKTRQVAADAQGSFMIRGEGWKYCRYADGEESLFNLRRDPGETRNLAGRRSARATKEKLQRDLDTWRIDTACPV